MRLTRTQRETLAFMQGDGHGTIYAERDDRTMQALSRKGLVTYRSRLGSYGKSHWSLTVEGACLKVAVNGNHT